MLGIYRVAAQLVASRVVLSATVLVNNRVSVKHFSVYVHLKCITPFHSWWGYTAA
jgi:hypothetical protein